MAEYWLKYKIKKSQHAAVTAGNKKGMFFFFPIPLFLSLSKIQVDQILLCITIMGRKSPTCKGLSWRRRLSALFGLVKKKNVAFVAKIKRTRPVCTFSTWYVPHDPMLCLIHLTKALIFIAVFLHEPPSESACTWYEPSLSKLKLHIIFFAGERAQRTLDTWRESCPWSCRHFLDWRCRKNST